MKKLRMKDDFIIDYIKIDGFRVDVGGSAKAFEDYFSIDSIGLVLGKNGSGKTHLLLSIAQVLTHGAGIVSSGEVAYWSKSVGSVTNDAYEGARDVGVIYFSPIPFRRSIKSHPRFVDASRIRSSRVNREMIDRYVWIAASLGAKVRVVARVTFRLDFLLGLIVSTLSNESCTLLDDGINTAREAMLYMAGRDNSDEYDESVRDFSRAVEKVIEDRLEDESVLISAMASLEHLVRDVSSRVAGVRGFLEYWQVATFEGVEDDFQRSKSIYVESFRDTMDVVMSAHGLRRLDPGSRSKSGVEFDVLSDEYYGELTKSNAAVSIVWNGLSSGMMSLVDQFSRLYLGLKTLASRGVSTILVLIDEGDVYLHLEWQRRYVEYVETFLFECKSNFGFDCVQVLIATHSPIISGDFTSKMVQCLDESFDPAFKTFANSMDSLVLEAFGTKSIGAVAVRKVGQLYEKSKNGELSSSDIELIDEIGDDSLRNAVRVGR